MQYYFYMAIYSIYGYIYMRILIWLYIYIYDSYIQYILYRICAGKSGQKVPRLNDYLLLSWWGR